MKYIFVTGGVLSGIGKGIAAASIGAILEAAGKKVFCQKFDGYLNVDPGTMNPTQHGEVFVTHDGAETDLDVGHYERFLNRDMNKFSSFTSGKLYEEIITREREGKYLGGTVQIVPHLTSLVAEKIQLGYESSRADISIIEIGGTVGDMENEYLLETARQLRHMLGSKNVLFIHVVLLPFLGASKEFKSKPIQHSVRSLMSYGISPDFLIVRADESIPDEMMQKIAITSGMQREYIISAKTLNSIYRVPLSFSEQSVGQKILHKLDMSYQGIDMSKWQSLVDNIDKSTESIDIALVGKYVDLEDAYYSLNEGLRSAGFFLKKKVKIHFIDAEDIEKHGVDMLSKYHGICIPGGFGERGIIGMISATRYAREHKIPFLGICLGSQIMAIEFARNVLGITEASSEEFTPQGSSNIIHIMQHQKGLTIKGGTMRLGNYECILRPDTLASRVYKESCVFERHRHRFEFNNTYRDMMESAGFIISGTSPDGMLVEVVEIQNHPYMIATQAHPEFISRPTQPHPLFLGFLDAMISLEIKKAQ